MRFYVVACIFLLFTSLALAEDAETIEVEGEEEAGAKDEGFCLSKDNCAASSAEDEAGSEKSEAKYTEEKQAEESDKEEGEMDKEDGDEVKEEEKKPKKGEEERHLVKVEVLEEGKFCDRVKASNDAAVTVHLKGRKASDGSEFITT